MRLTVTSVDYAPSELHEQVPFVVELERQMAGPDRSDYWLGVLREPLRWIVDNNERRVTHVVLAARWAGTAIQRGIENLPVGIAYVTDVSLLDDASLDLSKCAYVAIGIASETAGGRPVRQSHDIHDIQAGRIRPGFGTGRAE